MILKSREINDLYKTALNQVSFSQISLQTFKDSVAFFIQEKQNKWASQCYCQKCGNSYAAVRYINQLGEEANDEVFKNLNEDTWHEQIVCDDSQTLVEQMICLRNKKAIKKCFKHKKINRKCIGNHLIYQ